MTRVHLVSGLLFLVALASPVPALGRAGDLDTGYGRYGYAVLERALGFPASTLQPNRLSSEDLAAGPDGSYTAVGTLARLSESPSFPGGFGVPAVARYTRGGFPDPAFGAEGAVVLNLPDASARAVVVDGQGRAALAGFVERDEGVRVFVARLLPDGRLDSTFGSGGLFEFDAAFAVRDLLLQPDGKLVVGGDIRDQSGASALHVARLTADGALDENFGSGGIATFARTDSYTLAALAYHANGGIVTAGRGVGADGVGDVIVVRLTPGGEIDDSFGQGGEARPQFALPGGPAGAGPWSVAALPDGRIAVTATASRYDPALPREQWAKRPGVARLLPDGTPDSSFGQGGSVTTWVGIESDPSDDALVAEPSGNLVIAAYGGARAAVIRYRPDGSLDPSFGERGISRAASGALALARGPESKLAVLARADCGFGLGVARLDGSDEPDVSVRPGLVRLENGKLRVPLKGPRAASGRVTAYLERSAGRYPGDFGRRCPTRTKVASKRFRMSDSRRVRMRLKRATVRRIRRGTPLAFAVTSHAAGRRGATTTRWRYKQN